MPMHRSTPRPARKARVSIIALCALPILLACADDSGRQRSGIDAAHSGKLTGVWDITLRLERPLSLRTTAGLPRLVSGSIALLEDRHAERSFSAMRDPTHIGVYDIALDSLDLPPWDRGLVPGVAARIVPSTAGRDSIQIVVNPETPGHTLRLSGVFADDGVRGTWLAESPLGGGGTFTLRRGRGR
jgi:hypothetical protein